MSCLLGCNTTASFCYLCLLAGTVLWGAAGLAACLGGPFRLSIASRRLGSVAVVFTYLKFMIKFVMGINIGISCFLLIQCTCERLARKLNQALIALLVQLNVSNITCFKL
jgi:hypothetical protein